ncbi:hypothetical protein [Bordetella sp. FB-8]|uniref:hypothetical protein n=1 Tax=Bordetella sp. FB-8 TaxID=1159870 RepID=UPI0009D920FF|nr:hypothetical protein [Bordetella sp. FB-8]
MSTLTIRPRFELPRAIFCLVTLLTLASTLIIVFIGLPLALVPKRLWGWDLDHQFLGLPLLAVFIGLFWLIFRHLVRRYDKYEGVRVFAQRERPFDAYQTWSTHLGSPMFKSIRWRLRFFLFWKTNDKFLRVLEHKADRQVVNSMSLYAFESMLQEHRAKPGILIISTSLLNRRNRSATRLQDRIDAVCSQPGWRFERVVRDLGVVLSAASRFQYGWQSVPGEQRCRFQAPGIIAWRAGDGELSDTNWQARMKALNLRVATEEDLNSPVFSG